jgi:hypothetical protein
LHDAEIYEVKKKQRAWATEALEKPYNYKNVLASL